MKFLTRLTITLLLLLSNSVAFSQWANLTAGGANWVNCGDLDVSGTQLTVEALITMTGASAGEDIISKHTNPGDVNYLLRPGGFEITTTNGFFTVGSSIPIAMNICYHVAATYDGSFIRYYVNGCQTGQTACTGNMFQNNLLTAIGNQSSCQCEPFTGYIDEVRIWNVVRTSAQLQANMNTLPTPGAQVGLLAYYNMNSNVVNQQGNATYNGAIVGTVPYSTNPFDATPMQAFNSTPTSVNVDCNGLPNGSLQIATVGGNTAYQYSLNGGANQTANYYNTLAAGTYSITVTSAEGKCVQTVTVNITQPPALTLTVATQTNVSCNGGNNGAVTLNVSGGTNTATGTYSWSPNVSITNSATGLTAGQYTVTFTDDVCHSSGTELVTNGGFNSGNTGFSSGYAYTPPPNTAAAQYYVGTGIQTSTWNGGMFSNGDHTSGTGNYMLVNGAGTAGVSVWCQTVPVTANTNYNFSAWVSSLNNSSPAILEFSINGVPIGSSFNAPATWGSWQQFSASWNSGAVTSANICIVNLNTNPSGNDFGLDDISFQSCLKSCSTTTVVTITEPSVLTNTVSALPAILCRGNNSVLTNTINGGTAPYTTTWSSGGTTIGTPVTTTVTPGSTTTYTASVLDNNGCTSSSAITVTVNPLPTVSANSATICVNQQTATLTATGASSYTWSPSIGLSATNGTSVTATPSGNTTYSISGTDINGCVGTGTCVVVVNSLPTITANSATICVTQQTATITANGANTFTWSPASGLSSTSGSVVMANPALSTSYTVDGTDGNGCTNSGTFFVTVNPLPTLTVTNGVICNGSSVTLNVSGASTYTWSPAGNLSSSNGNNVTAFPTVSTNYTVTGTDANGCFNSDTTTVTVVSNPTVTVNSATLCAGGSATLTASGASTYTWSPATGLSATNGNSVTCNSTSTTVYTITGTIGSCTAAATATVTVNSLPVVTVNSATICAGQQSGTLTANGANTYTWSPSVGLSSSSGGTVNATPGISQVYTVTGTDANNCTNSATASVTVNALPIVTVNNATVCAGNAAALNANGAQTYTWSPGTGLSSTSGASVNANPVSTTTYTVSGTDANTCTNTATSLVTVVNNPTVTANNASICAGQQTAVLNAAGATSYSWSPASGLNTTSGASVNAAPASTTVYTITGSIGTCTAQGTCTVQVNTLPTITATSTVICNTSSATLTASGASTYTWSTMVNGSSISVAPSNNTTYTVAGTDGNGCTNFTTATVTVNPLPNVAVNSATLCKGSSVILTATGVIACTWLPATGLSSTVGTSVSANPVSTTQYTVSGTDANGCSGTAMSTVTVNQLPNVIANGDTICKGTPTTLAASGASTYNWNPGSGLSSSTSASPSANPAATTTYVVTGTDVNGCKNYDTLVVVVRPIPVVTIDPPFKADCVPVCATFSNSGTNNPGYSYSWNLGNGTISNDSTAQACYNTAGNYSVTLTVTDSNGCKNTNIANVVGFPIPTADFSFSPTETTILDPKIEFYDHSYGANIVSWNWFFGDGDSTSALNATHTYLDTGIFYPHLAVVSDKGCWNVLWLTLTINPEYVLYVPNAFTPDGDNLNDVFMPKGEGVTEYKLYVYDRWGNLMFKSDDITIGWDGMKGGQVLEQDVYAWKIDVRNRKGEPKHLSGVVSLLK